MKTRWIILCLALLQTVAQGQLPPQLTWVNYFQPVKLTGITLDVTNGFYQTDMVGDGYGIHYVTVINNQAVYFLLDNSGNVLRSTNFGANTIHPSITSFYDDGSQLTRQHVVLQRGSDLVLYRSTDGGVSWTALLTQPIQGTLVSIDSYEDLTGVHITYGSSTGIYYHLRNRTPDGWSTLNPFVASLSPPFPGFTYFNFPSVIASSDSSHIYTQQGFYSRRLAENNWTPAQAIVQHAYWPATLTRSIEGGTEYIRAWIWGQLEVIPPPPDCGGITYTRRRLFNSTTWDAAPAPGQVAEGGYTGWKPQCNNASSVFRNVYNFAPACGARVFYNDLNGASVTLNQTSPDRAGRTPAIGSDITGVDVVWWDVPSGTAYMRRKPLGVSDATTGGIQSNYAFSDTTWMIGTTTLASGKELRFKSGSVTFLWGQYSGGGPGNLLVSDGASLVIEPGAKLILQPPTGTFTQGGRIECGGGATVTVAGLLEAGAGSTLLFGSGSTMVVNGTFGAYGTSTKPVILTRSGTSGTWGGIVVDNCNASTPATLTYASLSHCATGISTRLSAKFGMDHCTLDDMEIGLEINPTQGDCPTSGPAIQVTNSTFTNITATGILVNSFSNLTLQGNTLFGPESSPYPAPAGITCINASPKLLGNTIKDFPFGVECLSGSAPVLEDGIYGGYNVITENGVGVLCQDGSNAVLGFLSGNMNDVGGMNSIAKNTGYDVSLFNGCSVSGENNWWGLDDDPPGIFDIDEGSKLDYDPWLDSDPNGDSPINVGRQSASNDDPMMDPMPAIARRALANMGDGHYTEAIQLLRTIFMDSTYESSVRKWAIRMLLVASQHQATPNLAGYLHASLTTYPALARTIRSVLPFSYLNERTHGEAMASFDLNLEQYPGSELAREALYGKFINALFVNHDLTSASRLQAQLESGFPSSTEASLAAIQLRCNQPPGSNTSPIGNRKAMERQLTGSLQLPREFMLGQNYPNPFNPTTRIQYSIPKDGHVLLVVYDVLGRQVDVLESGVKPAGNYTVDFDASRLASGVYMYRLQADGFSMVRRMLVVK